MTNPANPATPPPLATLPAFTILPQDKPFAGRCSRCGAAFVPGSRIVGAVWNDINFAYCEACQLRMGER